MLSCVYERNELSFFYIKTEDLTSAINYDHAICSCITSRDKTNLVCYSLTGKQWRSRYFVHEEVTHFGNDKNYSVLRTVLHQNWEISHILDLNISWFLEFSSPWGGTSYLHNMKFLGHLSRFLFTKTEEGILISGGIRDWHICKACSETFKDLLLTFFNQVKLHMTAYIFVSALINSN